MAHCIVEAAEEILDKEYPVLDHGFVRLVDYLGSDSRIVQAARVSYGEGTKTYRQDSGLINYLMRNDHTSPFEQVNFTFHIKMPIFVARQWIRHRTAKVNEISGRYSVMKGECYVPEPDKINFQSDDNKQGRSDLPVSQEIKNQVRSMLAEERRLVTENYRKMLELGIAREIARIDLPLSTYTEWYWQMDLHNLFHFLALRLDSHAQYEIRSYAKVILEIVRKVCPIATEAFESNMKDGRRFSKSEIAAIRAIMEGRPNPLTGRENEIFQEKLR